MGAKKSTAVKPALYDKSLADRAVAFINSLCHTKGEWHGKPFELLPWQNKIIRDVFGTVKESGFRRYNTAYIEIPKKMGKSELAAAVALYLLAGDNEWGAEVYGCAADRQQASINMDLTKVYTKPETLNAYLKKHEAKILEEFDTFFDCALPIPTQRQVVGQGGRYQNQTVYSAKANANEIIAAVIACGGISVTIKQMLIEKCASIIKIAGHERIFSSYIIRNAIAVPAAILWQFSESAVSSSEKLSILESCKYGADDPDPQKIKAFLLSFGEPYTVLFGAGKEARLEKNSRIDRLLNILKQRNLVSSWKKATLKDEYKVKAV
ncbi:hypothetical protein FACS1894211_00460 [Clostridia bacterium]|nr:hypothetical protein FACS1894211_00460 [Clostridia bacterium]